MMAYPKLARCRVLVYGVDRVWIVEPDNRDVLVFSSSIDSRKLTQTDDVKGEGPLQGFSLRIAQLFEA